jgi:flagellin
MSITSINTNVNALTAQAQLKKLDSSIQTTMTRLSSGLRINSGADGPSDLAIASAMEAHVRGIRTASNNAQDGLSLMQYADSSLNETMDILQRMNDLSVKACNQAILTSSDVQSINNELTTLKAELTRRATSISFNSKVLFSGGSFSNGQVIQIGADNGAAYKLTLVINAMTLSGLGLNSGAFGALSLWGAGSIVISNIVTAGGVTLNNSAIGMALFAVDVFQSAISIASHLQAAIGVQEEKLQFIINDLSSEDINVTAAKSRITDADMASEISNFTRLQVLSQAATAMLAQANLQPQAIVKLLGA